MFQKERERKGVEMDQLESYADDCLVAFCVHCAGDTETQDHCPSCTLLDKPYPDNLPLLPSCTSCNGGFSLDEEYFACLVECARMGSIEAVQRPKIRRTLEHSPALAARLMQARSVEDDGTILFAADPVRVQNVVLKLARGHAAFDLSEPQYDEPSHIMIAPLHLLSAAARRHFETPPSVSVWPEIGSRAMWRMLIVEDVASDPNWIVVQPGQYRYLAVAEHAIMIRFVVGEYLACEVIWNHDGE